MQAGNGQGLTMKKNPGYGEALEEIERIVQEIENESVDIDLLSRKVTRAAYLIKLCREKLKKTDKEVKDILDSIKDTGDPEP